MCGIFCSLSGANSSNIRHPSHVLETCLSNLRSRGPDHYQTLLCNLLSGSQLEFAVSVLQTQGKKVCAQPLANDRLIFCWNGDIFGGPLVENIRSCGLSDTEALFLHICDCIENGMSPFDAFQNLEGPYSFILFDRLTQTLRFGRDPAGRHSLLFGCSQEPFTLTLSSVAHSSLPNIKEVPSLGLFEIDLNLITNQNEVQINFHPWKDSEIEELTEFCAEVPLAVRFQAPLCQQYLFKTVPLACPKLEEEELSNKMKALQGLQLEEKVKSLFCFNKFQENMLEVLTCLEAAVKVRVETNLSQCQSCLVCTSPGCAPCCHSKVAILFSGGLDCAILARLVDKYVPKEDSIDLLNVAFEKKKRLFNTNKGKEKVKSVNEVCGEGCIYNVPDRLTGLRTFQELQKLCPNRKWNFVEINITLEELEEERSKCISHLIHPLKTVLDDSLGCALWFAARGQGRLFQSHEIYRSPARVIFTGMGADEQFGGYMRHRTTLKHNGWEALHNQLQMELKRIPLRNLGRDDRTISHHGRQPRMPYLDEKVISFVKTLPAWERCCPVDQLPCGLGDKLLLRLVAWHIGLQGAALLPKRALQFGSRIANSKENAADTSDRL